MYAVPVGWAFARLLSPILISLSLPLPFAGHLQEEEEAPCRKGRLKREKGSEESFAPRPPLILKTSCPRGGSSPDCSEGAVVVGWRPPPALNKLSRRGGNGRKVPHSDRGPRIG